MQYFEWGSQGIAQIVKYPTGQSTPAKFKPYFETTYSVKKKKKKIGTV